MMTELSVNILQGIAAFVATNLDDIVILMVFFSQITAVGQAQQIVVGQYLGFGILILLSLPGYLGGMLLPPQWIGLLGFVPLGIGIKLLLTAGAENSLEHETSQAVSISRPPKFLQWLPPQLLQVATVTVANGGDNLGIYVPLFASKNLMGLLVILVVFGLMVGVWCYLAWRLVKQSAVNRLLSKYGDRLIPWVFIALGCYILSESGALKIFR